MTDRHGVVWTSGAQRVVDDPTLRVDGRMIRTWAEHAGVCVRPLLRRVTDRETGDASTIPIPCGSTRERVCPSCATRARKLRQQQCREGWHLDDEPDTDHDRNQDEVVDDVQEVPVDEPIPDDVEQEDPAERRVRSTRRRDDASDLPQVPTEDRTVGRTWTGNDGQTYRPSMFVTLTLPSYGRITPGTGTPMDPDSYDYRRAALDAILLPRLLARWVQNLRRCAGFTVQYFAAVEPQKRLAPHIHLALRGAIPRTTLKAVTAATYAQVWWPAFEDVVYDETTTGLPVWDDGTYCDPLTRAPLPSWEDALDDLDAQLQADPSRPASHVVRFGAQTDVKGIIAPSPDADRTIRYLTKYLTKSLADTYAPTDDDAGDDRVGAQDGCDAASVPATARRARYGAHVDRLYEEVRWLPCSPECANWLRHGVQPKDCVPGLEPGRCPKRAHERDNLGYGGRRVQVSRKWSGKTLAQHKADPSTVVRETLAAAGISAPDIDRMGVDQVLDDGLPRFVWDDVPMPEANYAAAILASVRERNQRREQYEHAKQQLEDANPDGTGPPAGVVDNALGRTLGDRTAREVGTWESERS